MTATQVSSQVVIGPVIVFTCIVLLAFYSYFTVLKNNYDLTHH